MKWKIDKEAAVKNLMDLLAAEGPSGGEGPVAEVVKQKLLAAGCNPEWFRHAGLKRLPKGFTIGNLIVKIPAGVKIVSLRDEFLEFCDQQNLDAILEPVKR